MVESKPVGAADRVKCADTREALGKEGEHYINGGYYPISWLPNAFYILGARHALSQMK